MNDLRKRIARAIMREASEGGATFESETAQSDVKVSDWRFDVDTLVDAILAAIESVDPEPTERTILPHPDIPATAGELHRLVEMHSALRERVAHLEWLLTARSNPVTTTYRRCARCNGTGLIQCLPSQNQGAAMKTCDACNGQGVVR